MIDVEQGALRALEQDALALAALVVEQRPHRIHEGQDLGRDPRELVVHVLRAAFGKPEAAAQRIVMVNEALDLAAERREIVEVAEADGAPADLVLVGRTDAAPVVPMRVVVFDPSRARSSSRCSEGE